MQARPGTYALCAWGALVVASLTGAADAQRTGGEYENVSELARQLESGTTDRRIAAAYELGNCGSSAAGAISQLRQAVNSDNAELAFTALSALLKITGEYNEAVVAKLLKGLYASDGAMRFAAAMHLARAGPIALPAIMEALRAPDPGVRAYACSAVEQMGSSAVSARNELEWLLLKDVSAEVRASAAAALGSLGDVGAADALRQASKDQEAEVRASAEAALRDLGVSAARTGPGWLIGSVALLASLLIAATIVVRKRRQGMSANAVQSESED